MCVCVYIYIYICVCVCVCEGYSMYILKKIKDFFYRICFHKCKRHIVWNWFMAKIILSQRNICFQKIQNSVANRVNAPRLAQRSAIKSLVGEKCKPCEIYRRMSGVYGDGCFRKKMFENKLNVDLPLGSCVEKTSYRGNTLTLL